MLVLVSTKVNLLSENEQRSLDPVFILILVPSLDSHLSLTYLDGLV
jgi:hypothetical protein